MKSAMALQCALAVSLAATLGVWLTACGAREPPRKAPNLALACQTMDCVCTAQQVGLFENRRTADVLWRPSGDAYCPEGFVLESAGTDRGVPRYGAQPVPSEAEGRYPTREVQNRYSNPTSKLWVPWLISMPSPKSALALPK